MPKIKARLHEMTDADVHYVSLVDRSASRMPFRVMKHADSSPHSTESKEMTTSFINLSGLGRVLKGEKAAEVATVSGIVVFKQEDAKVMEAVKKALTDNGFKTDKMTENKDGTVLFAQEDEPLTGASFVRCSEQSIAVLKGFDGPAKVIKSASEFSSRVEKADFVSGISVAMAGLEESLLTVVAKSDAKVDVPATVKKMSEKFGTYLDSLVSAVPVEVFKADLAIQTLIEDADAAKIKTTKAEGVTIISIPSQFSKGPLGDDPTTWLGMNDGAKLAWANSLYDSKFGVGASSGKVVKSEDKKDDDKKVEDTKTIETPSGTTTETHKETPVETKKVDDPVLAAIAKLSEGLGTLVAKVDTVATAQTELTKKVEAVEGKTTEAVRKAEEVKNTVVNPAVPAEAPNNSMVVTKGEDTPKDGLTGAFDTANTARGRARKGGLWGRGG